MAVAVKFRAPYIFHRDSALEVHAWARLVIVLCFSLSNTGRLPKEKWNESGFDISYSKDKDISLQKLN